MDLKTLYKILGEATIELRKGEEIVKKRNVTEVYAMPHESEVTGIEKIDLHFIIVGVRKDVAETYRKEFTEIVKTYPNYNRFKEGLSYIELGRVLGSQSGALKFMALGEVLGLWNTIIPEKLGMDEAMAGALAGQGMVMITGVKC